MQSNLTAFSYLLPLFGAVIVDKYIGGKIHDTGWYVYCCGRIFHRRNRKECHRSICDDLPVVSLGLALFKNGAIIGRVVTDKSQMGIRHFHALYTGKCGCIHRNILVESCIRMYLQKMVYWDSHML